MASSAGSALGRFVYERRKLLGLDQNDIANSGGPSSATVRIIERGEAPAMQRGTKIGLERALDWASGSVDAILAGGAPTTLEDATRDERSAEVVGDRPQDDSVLLSMPPEALEGLSPADREEVITAAKLSALQTARAIRRRLDDEAHER